MVLFSTTRRHPIWDPRKQKPIQGITTPLLETRTIWNTEIRSTQRPSGKYQYKECRKNDDEEGYPIRF